MKKLLCIFCIFILWTNFAFSDENFYKKEINSDIFVKIKGKSYKDNCLMPLEDLNFIHILHIDVEGRIHEGEMICNKGIADDLLDIFQALYEAKYPIERVRLVDEYNADDETSMSANNSSCFNYRTISGTNKISMHGRGLAVDINPLYNPYHLVKDNGSVHIEPAGGAAYLDRTKSFDYKIESDDLCVKLFKAHGFDWGGDWARTGYKLYKDYQHFQKEIE